MKLTFWIFIGTCVGLIIYCSTYTRQSIAVDIILGISGALLGGLLINLFMNFGFFINQSLNISISIIFSIVVISIGRLFIQEHAKGGEKI